MRINDPAHNERVYGPKYRLMKELDALQTRLAAAEAERNAAVAALVGMEARAQRAEARLGRAEQLLLTGTQPQIEAYFKEREAVLAEQEKERP